MYMHAYEANPLLRKASSIAHEYCNKIFEIYMLILENLKIHQA